MISNSRYFGLVVFCVYFNYISTYFQLHGYFEYIRRDVLVSHIQPQDELQLVLSLTITFDTVTKSSQNPRQCSVPDARPAEVI